MSEIKLYIVRHGQTEWNTIGKLQGWQNSNLTESGIENALRLGERLKHIEFNQIYSSPLKRAMETAEYIKGSRENRIIPLDGFKEMGFGLWEGLDNEHLKELYEEEHFNYWNRPELYKPNGGETFEEFFSRIKNSLDYILNNSDSGNILLVSHGVAIKALIAIINNLKLEDFWSESYVEGTSLTILEAEGDKLEFKLIGDTSHFK